MINQGSMTSASFKNKCNDKYYHTYDKFTILQFSLVTDHLGEHG